jgi:hypothetical protein
MHLQYLLSFVIALLASSGASAAAVVEFGEGGEIADPTRVAEELGWQLSKAFKTEAEFLANHTDAQIEVFNGIRRAAKLKVASARPGSVERIGDTIHKCYLANPCTLTVSASYTSYGYIVLQSKFVNSNSDVLMSIDNGDADVLVGPKNGEYWEGCCNGDNCKWDEVTGAHYRGTCTNQSFTAISFWNHNTVEDQTVHLIFNNGNGLGPG